MATKKDTLNVSAELDLLLTPGNIDAKRVENSLTKEINSLVRKVTRSSKTGKIGLAAETLDDGVVEKTVQRHRALAEEARGRLLRNEQEYNDLAAKQADTQADLAKADKAYAESATKANKEKAASAKKANDEATKSLNLFEKRVSPQDSAHLKHFAAVQDKLGDVTLAQQKYAKAVKATGDQYKDLAKAGFNIQGLPAKQVDLLRQRYAAAAAYKAELGSLKTAAKRGYTYDTPDGRILRTDPIHVANLENSLKGVNDEFKKLDKALNTEHYQLQQRQKREREAAKKQLAADRDKLRLDKLQRKAQSEIISGLYDKGYSADRLNRAAAVSGAGTTGSKAPLEELQAARREALSVNSELNRAIKKQAKAIHVDTTTGSELSKRNQKAQRDLLTGYQAESQRAKAIVAELDNNIASRKLTAENERQHAKVRQQYAAADVKANQDLVKSKEALARSYEFSKKFGTGVEGISSPSEAKKAGAELSKARSELARAIRDERLQARKDNVKGANVARDIQQARAEVRGALRKQARELDTLSAALQKKTTAVEHAAKVEKENSAKQISLNKKEAIAREKRIASLRALRLSNQQLYGLVGPGNERREAGVLSSTGTLSLDEIALAQKGYKDRRAVLADRLATLKGRDRLSGLSQYTKSISTLEKGIANIDAGEAGLKNLRDGIIATNKELSPFSQRMTQASLLIKQFFRYALGYGALFRMLTAVQQLTRGVIDLDKALYSIQAISGATTEQMSEIGSAIKEVAVTTKFSTQEISKGAQILAQSGVDPEQISSVLKSVAVFAAGTESSLELAADLVSTMRNVYKELDDLTIANQLTKAINISKLTASDLKTILGISAQVTKQFNITSEQYLAAVTTLRNAGLKASTVATGLRQGLLEIFSPDSKTLKALQERYETIGEAVTAQGVRDKFFNFTQQANPLVAVLRELDRLGFTGSGRKTLARAFDVRAQNAITALITNLEELERAETRLGAGDSALKASETQMKSLANSAANLGAALTVLASDVTEGPVRSLESLIDKAAESVNALDELHIRAAALGEDGVLDALTVALGGGIAGAALGTTPAGRAVGFLAGATVGGYAGKEALETGVRDRDLSLLSGAADVVIGLLTWLAGMKLIKKVFGPVTDLLKKTSVVVTEAGKTAGKRAGLFARSWESMRNSLTKFYDGVKGFFKGGLTSSLAKVGTMFAALKTAGAFLNIVGWITTAVGLVWWIWDSMKDSPLDDLESARKRATSAKRQAVKARQRRQAILDELRPFEPSAGGVAAAPGGAAGKVEDLQNKLQSNLIFLEETFGRRAVENIDQFREEIADRLRGDASEETSNTRARIYDKLLREYGVDILGMGEDLKEHTLRILLETGEIENQISAKKEELEKDFRRLQKEEGSLSEVGAARLQALNELLASNVSLRAAMQGVQGVMTDTEFLAIYVQYLARTTEIVRGGKDLAESGEREVRSVNDEIGARFDQLAGELRLGEAGASLAATVADLLVSIKASGQDTIQFYKVLLESVDTFSSDIDSALVTLYSEKQKAYVEYLRKKGGKGLLSFLFPPSDEDVEEARLEYERRSEDVERVQRDRQGVGAVRDTVLNTIEVERQQREDLQALAFEKTVGILRAAAADLAGTADSLRRAPDVRASEVFSALTAALEAAGGRGLTKEQFAALARSFPGFDATGRPEPSEAIKGLGKATSDAEARRAIGREREALRKTIPDVSIAERVFRLGEEVARAEKDNLLLLASGDFTNPLIRLQKAQLEQIDQNILALKENVESTEATAASTQVAKDIEKYQSAVKALEQEKVKRLKIVSDTQKKIDDARFKLQSQDLGLDKKRLDNKLKALEKEIAEAEAEGDTAGLTALQAERKAVTAQLLEAENAILAHAGKTGELSEDILESKRQTAAAELRVKEANEFIAAISQRLADEYATGKFTTGDVGLDAYREAAGIEPTRAETVADLTRQYELFKESLEESLIAYSEHAMAADVNSEALRNQKDAIDKLRQDVSSLAGELENLTEKATLEGQFDDLLDLGEFQVELESLSSDITNLADNIRSSLVGAIDEIGPALTDALIEGESVSEALRDVFYDMFSQISRDLSANIFNQLSKKALAKIGDLFNIEIGTGVLGQSPEIAATNSNTLATQLNTLAIEKQNALMGLGGGSQPGSPFSGLFSGLFDNGTSSTGEVGYGEDQGWGQLLDGLQIGFQGSDDVAVDTSNAVKGAIEQQTAKSEGWFGSLGNGLAGLAGTIGGWISNLAGSAASGVGSLLGSLFSGLAGGSGAAKGAIIKGPGTGTSDSIPAIITDKLGKATGTMFVSNGEGILTAKAVDILGEDFVHKLNSLTSRPMGMAAGGVIGSTKQAIRSSETAGAALATSLAQTGAPDVTVAADNRTKIVNVVDKDLMSEYVSTGQGERAIVNVIRRRAGEVRNVLQ